MNTLLLPHLKFPYLNKTIRTQWHDKKNAYNWCKVHVDQLFTHQLEITKLSLGQQKLAVDISNTALLIENDSYLEKLHLEL